MVQGRAATMADVARLAGVSQQTVSRVLNHHTNVSRETRHRVLEAIRQLDYQPNALARGLVGRRSRPAGGARPATMPHGPAAGLLGIEPAALVQAAGARLAVEHLLQLGHRQVWHVAGPDDSLEARGRVEGWRAALADAGIVPPKIVTGDWTARSGYAAGRVLGSRGDVTAVFAGSDHMALGLTRALHELGIRVPDDVSVAGFDDIAEAEFLIPALTTIRQDLDDDVGRDCLPVLLRHAEPDPLRRGRLFTSSLVVRDSTARPATPEPPHADDQREALSCAQAHDGSSRRPSPPRSA